MTIRLFLAVLIAALFACVKPPAQESHWVASPKPAIARIDTIPSHLELYRRVQVLEAEAKSNKEFRERMWKRNPEMR